MTHLMGIVAVAAAQYLDRNMVTAHQKILNLPASLLQILEIHGHVARANGTCILRSQGDYL